MGTWKLDKDLKTYHGIIEIEGESSGIPYIDWLCGWILVHVQYPGREAVQQGCTESIYALCWLFGDQGANRCWPTVDLSGTISKPESASLCYALNQVRALVTAWTTKS